MWKLAAVTLLAFFALYLSYERFKSDYSQRIMFTNYLHAHVFDRSVEAYESQNATLSLVKIYQAQASLELLSQIAGGDAVLAQSCGDVHSYRTALYEQLQYYNSLHDLKLVPPTVTHR